MSCLKTSPPTSSPAANNFNRADISAATNALQFLPRPQLEDYVVYVGNESTLVQSISGDGPNLYFDTKLREDREEPDDLIVEDCIRAFLAHLDAQLYAGVGARYDSNGNSITPEKEYKKIKKIVIVGNKVRFETE